MVNRKLPFGYCMRNGQICIAEDEAETVRMIFDRYVETASYEKLADTLNGLGIPYCPGKRWNKNSVARILQNRCYTGNGLYPQILSPEIFMCAEKAKPDVRGTLEHPQMKDIRVLARCTACNEPMRRERKNTWRCSNCTESAVKIRDEHLILCIDKILQMLCEHPDIVVKPSMAAVRSEEIQQAHTSFTQELERTEFDEPAARTKAISLAAARFDALGSEDYETVRIQYILVGAEQNGELDTALLRQITSAILIHPNGAVSLKLKNGQIIERREPA